MQGKCERQLLNSTSKRVLRQLEENESLRIEIFRLRSDMRDQHHYFLNSTVNQQMLVEKIMTELSLACRRAREIRHRGENQILYNAVEHSIEDLDSILDSYGKLRGEWSKTKPEASEVHYEKLLKDCSARFDTAQETIEDLCKERDRVIQDNGLKVTQIEFLQGELAKMKQKYDQSLEETAALRAQNSKLCQTIADSQMKLNNYAQQVAKLKNNNDTLSHSLKESREVSNRHTEYLSSKCEGIERENKRLIEMQREFQLKEQQMAKVAAESGQQIQKLSQQTHRLKQEIHNLQFKFKEIIDKENKIKHLESIKQKKAEPREALSQVQTQNIIEAPQRPFKKEVGKMTNRKFNLQSFQEKLTTCNSSTSFFPH